MHCMPYTCPQRAPQKLSLEKENSNSLGWRCNYHGHSFRASARAYGMYDKEYPGRSIYRVSIARTPKRIVRASKVHASKRFAQSQKVRRRLTGVGKVGRHSEDNHEHAVDNCVSCGGSLAPRLSSRARKVGGNGNALDLDSERKDESERNAEQENSCPS